MYSKEYALEVHTVFTFFSNFNHQNNLIFHFRFDNIGLSWTVPYINTYTNITASQVIKYCTLWWATSFETKSQADILKVFRFRKYKFTHNNLVAMEMNLSPHYSWLTLQMVLTDRQLIEVKSRSRRHTDLVTSQSYFGSSCWINSSVS